MPDTTISKLILYFRSVLNSLSWHPTEDILVTSGLDRKAKLISFPEANIVQEIFLEELPILKANFIKKGS